MGSRWVLFPLIMLVSVSVGCSSSSKSTKSSCQTLSGKDEQIFIGDTVEKNYDPNVIMKRAESFYDQ
jgi:outer membrane protein assembly factor BamD